MPYGRSTRSYKPKPFGKAATRYSTTVKKNRAAAVAKARKAPVRAIVKNARAIKKLKNDMFGPIQTQITQMQSPMYPTANSPIFFHVNNPGHANHGPYVHWVNGNSIHADKQFTLYQEPSQYPFTNRNEEVVPNGPKLKLLYADFQFRFSGFVPDTRIRIDFVRQKKH